MTQTKLLAYCGLNLVKHKEILDDMGKKGILTKFKVKWGTKIITKYKVTQKGREFCQMILEPYEEMFPRKGKEDEK